MYSLIRKLLFQINPERVHYLAMNSLQKACNIPALKYFIQQQFSIQHASLEKEVFGLHFKNSVGLGAGFDKNATYLQPLSCLGFGFVEIGTVTPKAQPGNEPPRIMGIGPVAAVPKVLKQAGMNLADMELIELNEAFAAQSVAVIRELGMNPDKVNINGGAIALGHPLGCTGAKLTIQILNDLKRLNKKYGMVTACVGGGQGIAGIIERI